MTKDMVTITGKEVERIAYRGVPVITLRMMDELHQRPDGTAKRNFRANKEKLIENEDFFTVPYEEWSQLTAGRISSSGVSGFQKDTGQRNPMIFLTQSGYLMLVKSFQDDLAWQVQRELVNRYFVVRAASFDGDRLTKMTSRLKAENASAKALYDQFMLCEKIAGGVRKGKIPGAGTFKDISQNIFDTVQKHLNLEPLSNEDRSMELSAYLSGILKEYAMKGKYFTKRELEKEKVGKPVIDGMQSKFNNLKRTEISGILDLAVRKGMITEDTKIIGKGQTRVIYVPE